MRFNNYHPGAALKRVFKKRRTGCFWGALFLVPLYFYGVDYYQFKVIKTWTDIQFDHVWGSIAMPLSIFGMYILIINLSSKKNYNSFLILTSVMFIFSTWIYTDQSIAYFGVIGFVIGTTMLLDTLIDLGYKLTKIYNELEPFEKLTISIPVITILLNAILR
ncbi:hypothetical protein IRB23SM22_11700 [Alkalibacterium sp. s-m-22]